MKKLGILLTVAFFCIIGCKPDIKDSDFDGYIIKGQIGNLEENTEIFLDQIGDTKKLNVIDTAKLGPDGWFEMRGKIGEKSLARLRLGRGRNNIMLILDNEKINIEADFTNLKDYEISGSQDSEAMRSLIRDMQDRKVDDKYIKAYIDTTQSPFLAYMAVQNMKPDNAYESYKKVLTRMEKELSNSPLTSDFKNQLKSMEGALKTSVGRIAPDISAKTVENNDLSLASLRGKVVLLDFWASWCRPCRRENPNVVKAYNKYKDRGFEVYSVSLDKSKDRWVKAIADDGLVWDAHVSDLAGWKSAPAALYGVKSIPQTFLLDKEGKIIAKNLRGNALESKLKELLGDAEVPVPAAEDKTIESKEG